MFAGCISYHDGTCNVYSRKQTVCVYTIYVQETFVSEFSKVQSHRH